MKSHALVVCGPGVAFQGGGRDGKNANSGGKVERVVAVAGHVSAGSAKDRAP